jgi:IclR family transcriptional regulator, acetate operon repressor
MILSKPILTEPEQRRPLTSEVAERALDVLICFIGADGELGVSDIARQLGIDKSSVHRFLVALKRKGFVVDNPRTRRYGLGFRALELGRALSLQMNLEQQALPFLRELRDAIGETTGLSVRVGSQRVHIIQVESLHEIRRSVQIGRPFPLHVGANGKVLLAALPREERDAVLATSLADGPTLSPAAVEDLKQEIEETARRGYSITEGERVPGSRSMAAPVWTGRGDVIALLASGPDGRFSRQAAEAAVPALLDAAHRLTRQLGGQQPPGELPLARAPASAVNR